MRNISRIAVILLSILINSSIAQNSDAYYSNMIDSTVLASGKISLKLKGDYKITKQHELSESAKFEFKSATDFVYVKTRYNIEDSTAVKIISEKKFLIDNLFKTQPSPYPDLLTNQVYCPDSLKPWVFDSIYPNIRIAAYRLFANDRYIYGVYTADVILYTSAYILAYNKKQKVFSEIKYFTPRKKPVNIPEEVIKGIK